MWVIQNSWGADYFGVEGGFFEYWPGDYYTLSLGHSFVWGGPSLQITIDKFGNIFWVPGGGAGSPGSGISLVKGVMLYDHNPTEDETYGFCTGETISAGGGSHGLVGNLAYSPGSGVALEGGVGTPGVNVTHTYGYYVGNIRDIARRP